MFWFATCCLSTSNYVHEIVIGWVTFDLTGSAFITSLALGLSALPYFFISPLGGLLSDLVDRRFLLIFNSLYQGVITASFGIMIIMDLVVHWHILVFVVFVGLSWAIQDPTRIAIVPTTIPKKEFVNGFALNALAFNITRMVVPVLAGIMIVAVGPGYTLLTAATLFCCACLFISQIRTPFLNKSSSTFQLDSVRDLVSGFSFMLSNHTVLMITLLSTTPFLLIFPFIHGLLPVYAVEIFAYDSRGLGVLLSSTGLGATLGTLIIASVGGIHAKGRYFLICLFGSISMVIVFPLVSKGLSPIVVLMLMGGMLTCQFSLGGAIIHSIIPDSLRGRVTSIGVMTWGFVPVGGFTAGLLADSVGVQAATLAAGVILMMVLVCSFKWLRPLLTLRDEKVKSDA